MWASERVYPDAQDYFDDALDAINQARESIVVEMYIFRLDDLGARVLEALRSAARRGVNVRLVVDGFGSPVFTRQFVRMLSQQQIQTRIFHPTPGILEMWRVAGLPRLRHWVANINKRNHRKLVVVDRNVAFVGSCNIADSHLDWRETAVSVGGDGVDQLLRSFELIWSRSGDSWVSKARQLSGRLTARREWRAHRASRGEFAVRSNITRLLRQRQNADLVHRIEAAAKRVWITTAYFVPSPVILAALIKARRNGCDVRLLLPGKSDVNVVASVSRMFYRGLMRVGVRIYEYQPTVLHAKTLLIDDWACVGTTNLNHRSFYHDLEVDVVLYRAQSREVLADCFLRDLKASLPVTVDRLRRRPIFDRLSGYLVYPFRRFI